MEDISHAFSKEVSRLIPEIFNTIENAYSTIYLVGDEKLAVEAQAYFSENEHITLNRIDESEMEFKDGKYVLKISANGEEMLVFADMREEHPAVDCEGKGIQTFYLSRYNKGIKTTENLQDIDKHIIPKLLDHKVNVIKVYVPDLECLTKRKNLQRNMFFWNVLRHISPKRFERRRRRLSYTEYLEEEMHQLTNDNSKGYSLMYGNGKYINFDNGFRRTIGNPLNATKKICFFGPCFIRGLGCEDKDTIPSMIQHMVGEKYRVVNYGSEFQTGCYIMRMQEYHPGDIVVIFAPDIKRKSNKADERLMELDLTDIYENIEKVQNHVYDLPVHFDMTIQTAIVDALYEKMKSFLLENVTEVGTIIFGPKIRRATDMRFCKDEKYKKWLFDVEKQYPYREGTHRGAIVMNCNPFTNGHRYLIEYASQEVDELIVFVVREDKSVFRFEDRMRLVKLGTEDLRNVIVMESGNYMISSMTLPGYFEKADLQDTYLDAGQDLMLFTQIAQFLHIEVRFAGEEPLDKFTEQYNRGMREILPRYGISFEEIPRKENGGDVISASRVRTAMKDDDWDTVARLVPKTTLDFLQGK